VALVLTAAANALEFASAARKFERGFHAYPLAGSGDCALESAPVAVAVSALVAPIALLGTVAISQIARAPVGDLCSVPQRVGGFLRPYHLDKREGVVVLV